MDEKLPLLKEKAADIIYQSEKAQLITLDERDRRMEILSRASAINEIEPLLHDLRPSDSRRPNTPMPQRVQQVSTILGSTKRYGNWLESNQVQVTNILGETVLNLVNEDWGDGNLALDVNVILGELKLIVPNHVVIHNSVSAILGEVNLSSHLAHNAQGSAPVLTIRGSVLLGELKIKT